MLRSTHRRLIARCLLFLSALSVGCEPTPQYPVGDAGRSAPIATSSTPADAAALRDKPDAAGLGDERGSTADAAHDAAQDAALSAATADAGRGVEHAPAPLSVPTFNPEDWPMALHDAVASGHNPSERRISVSNVHQLEIKWRFDASAAGAEVGPIHASPVVADDVVYVGSMTGKFYALTRDGKLLWQYLTRERSEALTSIKSTPVGAVVGSDNSPIVGAAVLPPSHPYVIFGDFDGNIYALDRRTGKEIWVKEDVDGHGVSGVAGNSLLLAGQRLIVGFGSAEALALNALDPALHACCTFRGSAVSLAVATGEEQWRFYVVPESAPLPEQRAPYLRGPSGGSIWGQPSYDEQTNTVYVGTGANFSPTATGDSTPFTDAILALDATTGALKWSYQATKNDIWSEGLFNPRADGIFLDADFGDSPKIYDLPGVGKVVGAGQKTGDFHVVDARTGALVKRTQHLKMFSTVGGFQNLGGYANGIVYGHGADRIGEPGWLGIGESYNGSLLALSPDGERVLWRFDRADTLLIGGIALANGVLFYVSPFEEGLGSLLEAKWGLYAVDAANGAVLNHLTFPEHAISSPVVSRGRVYVTEGNVAVDVFELYADRTGSVMSLGLPGD